MEFVHTGLGALVAAVAVAFTALVATKAAAALWVAITFRRTRHLLAHHRVVGQPDQGSADGRLIRLDSRSWVQPVVATPP
jgi:hypothetical protein